MPKTCPLLQAGYNANPADLTIDCKCLMEECAWWSREAGLLKDGGA
jgi:hypothetical protein